MDKFGAWHLSNLSLRVRQKMVNNAIIYLIILIFQDPRPLHRRGADRILGKGRYERACWDRYDLRQ